MAGGHFNSFRDARGSEGGEVVALIITRVKITFPISFETMPESGEVGRGNGKPDSDNDGVFLCPRALSSWDKHGGVGFLKERGWGGEKHFSAGGGMELHRIHIKI